MFRRPWALALCLAPLTWSLASIQPAQASAPPSQGAPAPAQSTPTFLSAMEAAAAARQVPLAVIEGVAYVNTGWEWIATPQQDGGVGPMSVRPSQMSLATALSGYTALEIAGEAAANLDAGAALLAHYHSSGTGVESWFSAVSTAQGGLVAAEVFQAMESGATRTTSLGETITLTPQTVTSNTPGTSPGSALAPSTMAPASTTTDYPGATWIAADPSNYTVANRAHDYPIDMIIIHDIEGSYGSAIQDFETPGFAASAHYVVSYTGQVAQMVLEKDVAWHAGNWDYNTRAIGIEHEGYAAYNLYTTAEYNASAKIAASICSRWGVPLDRNHVIGHYQVPDPNNPDLYGGVDHHTDPGPYWNWTYYMATAQADAAVLPSPPHLMPDPVATSTTTGAMVAWQPARSCRKPITGYTVTLEPGGASQTLPATATSATFDNLALGQSYTFNVTAIDADGQDTQTSNSVIAGSCTAASLTTTPASPQIIGATVQFQAGSSTCANPQYEFWMLAPGGAWTDVQPYSPTSTFTWSTAGLAYGTYQFAAWVRDATSPGVTSTGSGSFDDRFGLAFRLSTPPCTSTAASASPTTSAMIGTMVTVTGTASGCASPQFEFWLQPPGGVWSIVQPYSSSATWSWATGGRAAGTYQLSVWSRNVGSDGTGGIAPNSYDGFSATSYELTPGCRTVTSVESPASSAPAGTPVTITATAFGCPNPRYEFWVRAPGGVWQVAQPYSATPSLTWATAGKPVGTYVFSVWTRDASRTAAYDAYTSFQYVVTPTPCASASASALPASPAGVGTTVTISATAAGCPNPRFEYWILPPGGTWTLVQPYATSSSLTWSTAGKAAGDYLFSIWVRDASSPAGYDAYATLPYALTMTPCASATASATPSTATSGTGVTVNAGAGGCPSAQFEVWVLPPGGTWTLVQPYSSSSSFTWDTRGKPAGTYVFSVWARDTSSAGTHGSAPNTYDAYATFQFALT